jgi:predicted GNAT family N-acyltransferase
MMAGHSKRWFEAVITSATVAQIFRGKQQHQLLKQTISRNKHSTESCSLLVTAQQHVINSVDACT